MQDVLPFSWSLRAFVVNCRACFFVAKEYRSKGPTLELIRAAVEYVRQQGGKVVEAYPTVPKSSGRMPPVPGFMGLPSVFERAGFV